MATRELLSPAQRRRLTEPPDPMDEWLLARHYTLSAADLAAIGKRRRPDTKIGSATQLCYLRFPGRPLRSRDRPPTNTLEYIASQLDEDPAVFDRYARVRDTTRRGHLTEIVETFGFGFRAFDEEVYRELYEWLLPTAMSTERGTALVEALLGEMRRRGVVAPAISTLEELCWEVRRQARSRIFEKLTGELSVEGRQRLDELLMVTPDESRAPLVWLREPPGAPAPKNFHKILDRLRFVRSLNLPDISGRGIHNNRLTQLAREGEKTTPQHLRRFDNEHRHATLVAHLSGRVGSLTDEALDMHDRLMSEMFGKGQKARDENFQRRGKAINEKVGLYAGVGKALIQAKERGEDPYPLIEELIGWERFVASVEEAEELAMPADFDYLDHLQNQHRRLRGYAPAMLEAFDFEAAPPAEPVLQALEVLREMNASGKRKVPDDAPTDFVTPRWERHVFDMDGAIDKPFYEMGAMNELNRGLRAGDSWVSGSRRYADSEDYLLPQENWEEFRGNSGPPLAITPDLDKYLAERSEELHRELTTVNRMISRGQLQNVRSRTTS